MWEELRQMLQNVPRKIADPTFNMVIGQESRHCVTQQIGIH